MRLGGGYSAEQGNGPPVEDLGLVEFSHQLTKGRLCLSSGQADHASWREERLTHRSGLPVRTAPPSALIGPRRIACDYCPRAR